MVLSARPAPIQGGSVASITPGPGDLARPVPATRTMSPWQQATRESEKRRFPRRSLQCTLTMLDRVGAGQPMGIPAECSNISQGGLYAVVPIGYGVAIGQRYKFQLTIGERGPEPGSRQTVSQQGEIVRAELLLGEDGYGDRVGIGVRLFGPRTGLVPMPMNA
jgi:hypothetical protein